MFKKIGLRTIKTGIAVTLSLLVSSLLKLEYPFFVAMTSIISMDKTAMNSMKMGRNRILGTFIGAIVGILFIIGFIASAYSTAGGALTALTTSFTVDILNKEKDERLTNIRNIVHIGMTILIIICICIIQLINNDSVIQTVFKIASYTYGPLLGMFCFGIITKQQVRDRWIPLIVIAAPVITWIMDVNSTEWLNGYEFSHERLLLNALLTFVGMMLLVKKSNK